MKYYLVNNQGFKDPDKVEIDYDTFTGLQQAKEALSAALRIETIYDILLGNYKDFEKELNDIALEYMVHSLTDIYSEFVDFRIRLNKRLINLLTSTRMFCDQVYRQIKVIIQDPQIRKNAIRPLFHKSYDENIEYRFMEALRNYTQHCGLPVHGTSHFAGREVKGQKVSDEMMFKTCCFFYKEQISRKDFKPAVFDEMPDKVDMKIYVRKYVYCFSQIHVKLREIIDKSVSESREKFEEAHNLYGNEGNSIRLALSLEDDVNEIIHIILDWDDVRIQLANKNKALIDLSGCHVSGAS